MLKKTLCAVFLLVTSCTTDSSVTIEGTVSNLEPTEFLFELQPIHYKFAEKSLFPVEVDDSGWFTVTLPVESEEIAVLSLDGIDYPVPLAPGRHLKLEIDGSHYPLDLSVSGGDTGWNERYQEYLRHVQPLELEITDELIPFRQGEPNRVLELYRQRVDLARDFLYDTPLVSVYYANTGEYLNRALQNVTYRKEQPGFDHAAAREEAFDYARQHDFFSLESQKSQRAGIRDFAHNYAMSYDIQDSLRDIHGEQLSDQDIRRLGYEQLNGHRERVIREIEDEAARAHAEMHLVAKRLGEMPLTVSEPSLTEYLQNYPSYEAYTDFLLQLHSEVSTVSPGEPAVPFSLPDPDGRMVSMSDYEGRYVLLDFWASWCVPCLEEFPDMKRIYENTSRDQFEIIAISTEQDSLVWRRAIEEFDNPWIQLYGGNEFQQETFVSYKGGGIPFYILVNPDGKIERYNDVRATYNLESVLDSLLSLE